MGQRKALSVLFADIGGVLIENPWIAVAAGLSTTFGLDRAQVFHDLDLLSRDLDKGEIDLRSFNEKLSHAAGRDIPQEYFEKLLLDESPRRILPVWNSLFRLRSSAALKIIALSNMSRDYWSTLETRFHISSLFDATVLSYELGVIKPDPTIFRIALERAGSPAHLCMFMDDSAANIRSAKTLGLNTHLVTDPKETSAFLLSLGT